MNIDNEIKQKVLDFQKNEITEYFIYRKLAGIIKSPENKHILENIADDEIRHYNEWRRYTEQDVSPCIFRIFKYYWISRILGLTFGIKLMEKGEEEAEENYEKLTEVIPEARDIMLDENHHETVLLGLLDEEKLQYMSSMVLGLNDALMELTGALAGFTLALQNTRLIAMAGLITGIAAALSMSASEYLSTKSEDSGKNPLRASVYTGAAYIITVIILILPYLLLANYYFCLALSLTAAIVIIALFNYYISVAKDQPFGKRFFEMAGISLSVAGLSFLIGYFMRIFLDVDI
jgi:vacuolar iron transporter family protein